MVTEIKPLNKKPATHLLRRRGARDGVANLGLVAFCQHLKVPGLEFRVPGLEFRVFVWVVEV